MNNCRNCLSTRSPNLWTLYPEFPYGVPLTESERITGKPELSFRVLRRLLIGSMEATGHETEAALANQTHHDKVSPAPARSRACKKRGLE